MGDFRLDTLQIYFPWDDDFYTILKEGGFGKEGQGAKALPLIYTDNTESTVGKPELKRKFVIRPELFGKNYSELGWKETSKGNEPIIPAEKPRVRITTAYDKITFRIFPKVNDKNQYHLEYSSRSAFGKMYGNWVTLYFSLEEMKKIFSLLESELKKNEDCYQDSVIITEKKQNQREEIEYVEVKVDSYQFSLGEFEHAARYLKLNGYTKNRIPSLVYDSKDKKSNEVMSPIAKVGILHTTGNDGFDKREPQFVIKISQNKITQSKRGKKAKVKGIVKEVDQENKIVLDSKEFHCALLKLLDRFREKHPRIKF